MNKIYSICLTCGKVWVKSDINDIDRNYIFKKDNCPNCNRQTQVVVTKNINRLKKDTALDNKIKKLIRG